ncbi:DUF4386 family protein [Xanthomonas oryzae]|uniref:DUF4386 family protein n=1 Tax=Xanthomonas oryzae TaxID=347 RepID=UPI001CC97A05|nr:DUF4386 family protein [Xanthomonas oryzae]
MDRLSVATASGSWSGIVVCAVEHRIAVSRSNQQVFQLRVLPLASSATGASPEHGVALASMALLGHGIAFNSAPIFSGAACLVSGSVIYRSTYLPRTVGVLMLLAGISYLIAAFA